jgi:hypothetical protein
MALAPAAGRYTATLLRCHDRLRLCRIHLSGHVISATTNDPRGQEGAVIALRMVGHGSVELDTIS